MTRLRKRLIEDMTVRNLAATTQATYVYQVSMFARHSGESPETLGPEDIRDGGSPAKRLWAGGGGCRPRRPRRAGTRRAWIALQ